MTLETVTARRSLLIGAAALGGLAAASSARAAGSSVDVRTSLHQEVDYPVAPQRVYEALLSSKTFASATGMEAKISPAVGGAVWMFGGLIQGVNIELVPGKRIVQAWRPVEDFPAGVYSLVKFELAPKGSGTRVILDHTGFPPGHFGHLNAGWPERYWKPLRKVLV